MLILGAYPRQFVAHGYTSDLIALNYMLKESFPTSVGIHVLPMWLSEGDGGFAVSTWTEIDPQYGTPDQLRQIGITRFLILDGVYNHVGWRHPIITSFMADPENNSSLIHAARTDTPPSAPLAPRGGSMYRELMIHDTLWHIWQTFGRQAVDVNLSSPAVLEQVVENLRLLSSLKVGAVRLDALAYYGKSSSTNAVHNPDGIAAAKRILNAAHAVGLTCMLQIDCDSSRTFYDALAPSRPIFIDYSFSTYYVFGMMTGDTAFLATHLQRTRSDATHKVLRPLRTHDGILMRSGNQPSEFRSRIESLFRNRGFQLRYTNDDLYESNHSLPHLLDIARDAVLYFRKVASGLVLAGLTAEYSYVYINSLCGDWPEGSSEAFPDDPRELQRRPLHVDVFRSGAWRTAGPLQRVVTEVASWGAASDLHNNVPAHVTVDDQGGVLRVRNESLEREAFVNFTRDIRRVHECRHVVVSDAYAAGSLGPYGYVACRC